MAPSHKVGLACAGGVIEGALYEIGALCALDELVEGVEMSELDSYVGVSSGALLCAALANGVSPQRLSESVLGHESEDLNLRSESFFRPAYREYLRRIWSLPRRVIDMARSVLAKPLDTSVTGIAVGLSSALPAGLFDNRGVREYLRRVLSADGRTDDFRKLKSSLRVVATNVETAEVTIFGGPGLDDVPISHAVQASTALPGLYCPVTINGHQYIDGVARRTVHASIALEQGVDLLFCVNPIVPVDTTLHPENGRSVADGGLPTVLSQTFRTVVHSRMRTGFKKYAHRYPDADIILIEPRVDDYSMFFSNIFSFANRKSVCEHAYDDTRRYIRENEDEIRSKLERRGLSLRSDRLHDLNRTLYGVGNASEGRLRRTIEELDAAVDKLCEEQ